MIDIKKIYEKEIEKIINNKENKVIFLVGSSKNIDLNDKCCIVNDIDLFIISNQEENQIRELKNINNIEFDINYFSKEYANQLIQDKEYFFINELKDAKVIYDCDQLSKELIMQSLKKYEEGPECTDSYINSIIIYENIIRLKNKEKYRKSEYEFLTNIYLKDIIREYFNINKKWIPKDKKIFKYLNENDKYLLDLLEKVYENYDYNRIEDLYNYVFNKVNKNIILK